MQDRPIIPIKERCRCGRRVTDHHLFCNKCHQKRDKRKFHEERKKLLIPLIKRLQARDERRNSN